MMNAGQKALMRSVFAGPIVDHYGQTERVTLAEPARPGATTSSLPLSASGKLNTAVLVGDSAPADGV
jgi:hypothetical protein